ncbi:MAG: hypothetical protein IBJ10_00925 [Phycisphaerales bacterium]|nr:hypothetical protein [Phycisphaerales bacterium]
MGVVADAAYLVAAVVSAPLWMRKKRAGWSERFGRLEPLPAPAPGRPRLLIHAVSVGEVNLIRALVDRLAPEADLVVATTTDTGTARAKELYTGRAHLVRYPLDASWCVRRFLDAVRPDGVALVELELWPNFARACRARGVPLAIVNGRLSDRSAGRYRAARPLLGRDFRGLEFIAAQDEVYAGRFRGAGARAERVRVVGSMKWDAAQTIEHVQGAEALGREMGIDPDRPLIVAGSTAPEEHALLRDATPEGVQLLCAPRRPEWWDDAADALGGCVRRSRRPAGSPGSPGSPSPTGRYLLDTIGELRKAYALADVAIVGRSFGSLFGSDPMEPAALGKPVVIGPAVADFRTVVETMKHEDAILQITPEELAPTLTRLFTDANERRARGARALACVRKHQGSTERHARLLLEMLGRSP